MSQKTRERYEAGRKVEAAAVPAVAQVAPVWNGLRRLWMVATDVGMVPCDPQPAAPSMTVHEAELGGSVRARLSAWRQTGASALPPAVKVSA